MLLPDLFCVCQALERSLKFDFADLMPTFLFSFSFSFSLTSNLETLEVRS